MRGEYGEGEAGPRGGGGLECRQGERRRRRRSREGRSGFKDKKREEERTVTQGERHTEIGGVVVCGLTVDRRKTGRARVRPGRHELYVPELKRETKTEEKY